MSVERFCNLYAETCHRCGNPTDVVFMPTDQGPMTVSLLCASCQSRSWEWFVWIKGWALRFERWGFPRFVIGAWWTFWTWAAPLFDRWWPRTVADRERHPRPRRAGTEDSMKNPTYALLVQAAVVGDGEVLADARFIHPELQGIVNLHEALDLAVEENLLHEDRFYTLSEIIESFRDTETNEAAALAYDTVLRVMETM